MTASIIVCTRNRASRLDRLLRTLEGLVLDDASQSYEVVVADNGSTDDTPEVIRAAERRGVVQIVSTTAPEPGKSYAYDAGIRCARGRILVFTDDDVEVDERWLDGHVACYDDPLVGAVQGRILLQLERQPPKWFGAHHETMLARLDAGDDVIVPWDSYLIGANMSMLAEAALSAGAFNKRLGPGRSGYWEDSEFSQRLHDLGVVHGYQPGAVVRHVVAAERLNRRYFLRAAFRNGRSCFLACEHGACPFDPPPLSSLPGRAKAYLRELLRASAPFPAYSRSHASLDFVFDLGMAWERLRSGSAP